MDDWSQQSSREILRESNRKAARERKERVLKQRRRFLVGGLLAAAAISLAAVIWLFSGGDQAVTPPPNLSALEQIDGTLLVAEDDQLVMRPFEPFEGQDEVTFVVRPRDAGNFDLAHLRSHSAIGLPTRVFFRRDGDSLVAVYKDDAPVNSSGG